MRLHLRYNNLNFLNYYLTKGILACLIKQELIILLMKIKSYLKKFSIFNSQLSIQKGFTLIELLIVIAILGILAAGILVSVDPVDKISAANDAKVQNDVSAIGRAAEAYSTQQSSSYTLTLAELVTYGELKRVPVPPTAYGTSYTYTAVDKDGSTCTTAAKTCTSITVTSPLLSKKYTNATTNTPFWRYESSSGKSCAVQTATTSCP